MGKEVGRASNGASSRQRARGRCLPCPRREGVEDDVFGADVFGDDVKMTVNGERRVWAGREAGELGCHIQKLFPLPARRLAKCGQLGAVCARERCCRLCGGTVGD